MKRLAIFDYSFGFSCSRFVFCFYFSLEDILSSVLTLLWFLFLIYLFLLQRKGDILH